MGRLSRGGSGGRHLGFPGKARDRVFSGEVVVRLQSLSGPVVRW